MMFWSCKEQKPVRQEITATETTVPKPIPKLIGELCAFAGITITDSTDISSIARFKIIDSSGTHQEIKIEEATSLFKRLKSGKKVSGIPVMEFKELDKNLVMFQGRGYGGPIWATILLKKKTRQIEKVEFEHRAESEGYGSGMTMSSFENQFTGIEIKRGVTLFGLKQGARSIIQGEHEIDGMSGGTVTGQGVVNMLNPGFQMYVRSLDMK
jgi:Na+-transporting NADH:ubiquinone oxidoreductase subunit C